MNFVSDLLDVSDDGVYQGGRWGDIVVDVSEYCTLCLWISQARESMSPSAFLVLLEGCFVQ